MRRKWVIKLKRCPSCRSCNIYRRVRKIHIERRRGRANKNFIEEKVKHYRCIKCKHEFDNPIIE